MALPTFACRCHSDFATPRRYVVRPVRFELTTFCSGGKRSAGGPFISNRFAWAGPSFLGPFGVIWVGIWVGENRCLILQHVGRVHRPLSTAWSLYTRIMTIRTKQIRCPECKRTGAITPGPIGELGMCECGTMVCLPAKPRRNIKRRHILTASISIVCGVIANLLTPVLSHIAGLVGRRRVEAISVSVSDGLAMQDQMIVAIGGLPSGFAAGTATIAPLPHDERQSIV